MPILSVSGENASLTVHSNGSLVGFVYPYKPLVVSSSLPLTISAILTNPQAVLDGVELDGKPVHIPWNITLVDDAWLVVYSHTVITTTTPDTTQPQNSTDSVIRPVGSSCTLMQRNSFGKSFYSVKDYQGNLIVSWGSDMNSVEGQGNRNASCHIDSSVISGSQPATNAQLSAGLASTLSQAILATEHAGAILVNIISNTAATLHEDFDNLISALKQETTDLVNKSAAMMLNIIHNTADKLRSEFSSLVDPIWASMDEMISKAEEEAASWRKGILDLEGSLKAWISASILEIIWAAITRDSKED